MSDRQTKEEYLKLLEEKLHRIRYHKLNTYFPDTGPYRREFYPKHIGFFEAGATFPQRIFMAGNRTGKTEAGAFEMACHLTGLYPDWWNGKRFKNPIKAWASSLTGTKTRDTCQFKLLGQKIDLGTGFIPKDFIERTTAKPGIPDGIETVWVKHVSGGMSELSFKSYDTGASGFVGTEMDVIWLDEECAYSIYSECLIRTMTTKGIVYITFTPDNGMSETVLSFFKDGMITEGGHGFKHVTTVGWDECPHLEEQEKKMMLEALPPWQRDAKSKGIPTITVGAIYPVSEDEFVVDPFEIPKYWPRAYGLDVGWNRTASIFSAWDRDTDTVYLYDEYYRGQAEPSIHADAIQARGIWIPGVIDPASRGRSQKDGEALFDQYVNLGLKLDFAQNTVEAGIYEVWTRLSTGRLKIFKTCQHWLAEKRLYRRDDQGKIVKENDHLMDATRYLIMSALDLAICKPVKKTYYQNSFQSQRDSDTGY
jgi:phage terminase large subunit-like protein